MSEALNFRSEYYTPASTVEEDFVNLVKLELNDIKNSFFKIGFRLAEAHRCKYYKKLGFNTIEECAESLFGFKKTTTYDLINISVAFCDRKAPMFLDDKYKGFSQSQLVLFSSIGYARDGFILRARPEDSIEKLKKAKKYWKEFQVGRFASVSTYQLKTIDDIIELYESKLSLPVASSTSNDIVEHADHQENFSGYPEKNTEKPIVLDIPENEVSSSDADLSKSISEVEKGIFVFKPKDFRNRLISHCGKRFDFLDYKTIWDPDNKGLGVRVLSEDVANSIFRESCSYIEDNRPDVKNLISKYLSDKIGSFDYHVQLCGRTQNINVFCNNVASFVLDFWIEAFSANINK